MRNVIRRIKPRHILWAYLCLYGAASFATLTRFPFVHSDESWLSGLTRNMLEHGGVWVTEPFFDLKPRYPHAIKTLFHLLQMLMLRLFGYQISSFRLLSLAAGIAALALFYAVLRRQTRSPWYALVGMALLSADAQFVYASHFARAEMLLLLSALGCFLALTTGERGHPAIAAVITGLCIGLHPNSFMIGGMCGALLVLGGKRRLKDTIRPLALYAGVASVFLLAAIGLTLRMDAQFFRHYFSQYGSDYQVHGSILEKLMETGPYFQRLWNQISGTYHTADIRLQLLLFAVAAPSALALLLLKKKTLFRPGLSAILGLWLAMVLIGRFGQPYVALFFPFGYLLVIQLIRFTGARRKTAVLSALAVAIGWLSLAQILPPVRQPEQYDRYLQKIAGVVPPDAKTLGNLNTEYHFQNGMLLDYRNLPYLAAEGLSVSQYLSSRKVEYILYSSELELLYSLRPLWNHIYGDLDYLPELQRVLREECTLLYSFVDNQYANRVVGYRYTGREFTVTIYRYDGAASF
ncbi:MAG: glycosyltransferase family 39 protein [Clostridia bacterium]|nr:glycosyltransferase family 39 protein [Clostridia bacterium]